MQEKTHHTALSTLRTSSESFLLPNAARCPQIYRSPAIAVCSVSVECGFADSIRPGDTDINDWVGGDIIEGDIY